MIRNSGSWFNSGIGIDSGGIKHKSVHKCLKGPKTTYTTIAVAEKQSKRNKRAHFRYTYIKSPGSHSGDGINRARGGGAGPSRSTPVSPAMPQDPRGTMWRIGVGTMVAVGSAAPTIFSQWVKTRYSAPTIFWNETPFTAQYHRRLVVL